MEKKSNFSEFETEIKARGIEYLIHFTPTINLYSIFEQGKLLSRALLEKFDIEQTDILDFIHFVDQIRYDDKAYINLSIQRPNLFLFHLFMERTKGMPEISWCVLKINPKYIYSKETLFSVTNAANNHNKNIIGITGDIQKFKMMFSPTIKIITFNKTRIYSRENLKPYYPTDEQAEVLVKNEILVDDIYEVCFRNEMELAACRAALGLFDTTKFSVDQSIFQRS